MINTVKYRVNGQAVPKRLCRRPLDVSQFIGRRHELRREARDHFHSTSGSRVSPGIEDITHLELWAGATLLQRIDFKGMENVEDDEA